MSRSAFVAMAALAVACGTGPGDGGNDTVRPGLEVFLADPPEVVLGKRIGLITSDASVDRRGRRGIDLIAAHPRLDLVALFAFEHGLGGTAPPGAEIGADTDAATGLPVHSLYGETRRPTPEMLEGVELLVYDAQDSGSRTYTRVSTMALAMEAAAEAGIAFVVLDRPNPIRGDVVEGPVLDTAFSSFVGMYPIPLRHGMTVGELARMYHRRHGVGAEPHVVPVAGWTRDLWFDGTGLPWRPPSPNLPRLEAVIHYPGTVLVEGTNLSEGRGTDRPFEQVGAPWLRAEDVADEMNARKLPGVRFSPVTLEIAPEARKYGGETIPGVRMTLTERDAYRPVRTALRLLETVRRLHPGDFEWRAAIDRLAGTDRVRKAVEAGSVETLLREMEAEVAAFRERREPYLLYPDPAPGPGDDGTLVAVFAHPDDERIVGPLLARYAREGHAVHLVVATDGRKGVTDHAGIPAGDSLAALRADETRCATDRLGIGPPILLGLEDAGLASFASLGMLRDELRRIFRELEPDAVITFGPEGGTGHPDHRLVGVVVTQIVQSGGDGAPEALYYPSLPTERMADAPPARPSIITMPGRLLPVSVPFTAADLEAGHEAFDCHRTQYTGPQVDSVMRYLAHGWEGAVRLRPWLGPGERRTGLFER